MMNIKDKIKYTLAVVAVLASAATVRGEDDIKSNQFNPVNTGVTTLSIAPDARGTGMGNLGAATDPDINSQFWNPSKYPFAYQRGGVSLSYTPWLRKIVNDIFLADLCGFWKPGDGENQAFSASLRYFSLGEVHTSMGGAVNTTINPYECAFDFGYSRKLSENFSMGVVLRYILSDLSFTDPKNGEGNTAASAFAVDLSAYHTSYPIIGRNECQLSWGVDVSNVGTKVSYDGGMTSFFLPTNLRVGTNFMFPLADYNTLSLGLDLNKLLVPTKPRPGDYATTTEYDDAEQAWMHMSPITGIFKSFSDAPGGMKEELQEIGVNFGAEYAYNNQFFVRGGYNYEHPNKGGHSYFAFGAGFSMNVAQIDASYMLATAQSSPLDQTLRFSISFDMDGLKELFGR